MLLLVSDGPRPVWVAYIDDADEYGRVWVHVPNTGRFHRHDALGADYYRDQDFNYTPIAPATARWLCAAGIGGQKPWSDRGPETRDPVTVVGAPDPGEELSADERAFLLASTDLTEADLTAAGRARTAWALAEGTAAAAARVDDRWRYGTDGLEIRGVAAVVAALPESMHPLDIETFMTTPNDDVLGGVSPVAWLASGRPIAPVVALADEQGYL